VPAAYSLDLRERVVTAVEEGLSRLSAARLFKVGISTVNRWSKRFAETGGCAAKRSGGDHKSHAVESHKEWLLDLVTTGPDLTLEEIRTRLRETHGLEKSVSRLWRFFDRHDVTFKKNPSRRRTGPPGRESGARGVAGKPDFAGPGPSGLH
jgi:transposase